MRADGQRTRSSGTAVVGRGVVLVGGILVTQLAAIAVNSAAASTDRWPFGLDHVRRHPFAWSAALTALLALIAIITFGLDVRRANDRAEQAAEEGEQAAREGRRAAAETLLLQLNDLVHRLGVLVAMLEWPRLMLDVVLVGTDSPDAKLAVAKVGEVQAAIDSRRDPLRSAVDRAIERLRVHGGRRDARPRQSASEPAVDPTILSAAEASAAHREGSVAALKVWLSLVGDQLQHVGDELRDLMIELDGAYQMISGLADTSPADQEMITGLRHDVTRWRRDLAEADERLTVYGVRFGGTTR